MSWPEGVQFFKRAVNNIEDQIISQYEQAIYIPGFLNMLMNRDLEIESIEQLEQHVLAYEYIDRRLSLNSKYMSQIEEIFKSVRSHGVLPYVMASTKESVERSELKSLDRHSSKAIDAVLAIVKMAPEYNADDEFFIGDLVSVFRLTEEDIDHINRWHPELANSYTTYEHEKISHEETLGKKYSRLKNYSEIKKKVKTVETNWKRALAKERKKVLETVNIKNTRIKSESKTSVENKFTKDQSELVSKYPYSEDDFRKYDKEILSKYIEFRDDLVQKIQSKTKVSCVDIELVLDFLEDSLLDNILGKKGWDLFDLLHIEIIHKDGGAKHKIENPHSGEPMNFKSKKYTVTGALSPRLKRILDGEEIHYQSLGDLF